MHHLGEGQRVDAHEKHRGRQQAEHQELATVEVDWFRRQKVRSLWVTPLSSLAPGRGEDDDRDPLETLQEAGDSNPEETPPEQLERSQVLEIIEQEIARLPPRQREAFLMRYWEELDVAETAKAMGCSEGSVKTHCSRGTHALAAALRSRGITL